MKNNKILVKSKSKEYPIYIGNKNIKIIKKLIKKNIPDVKKICIISDKNVPLKIKKKLSKCLKKFDIKIFSLNVNEKIKSFKIANNIAEKILQDNFNRSDCIIGLGGGIVGDLAAFVASIVKRGIKFVNIPTTLLAQVDSSIGGKTGVNSAQGKNLIGTFYQPDFVVTDVSTLDTLPHREMICGYGEILKHSFILDKNFFNWLKKNGKKIIIKRNKNIIKKAIIQSCKIKSKIVEKDEKEKNLRKVLNFGHTFAHGFEAAKNFSKKLNHGEAVLLGMVMASKFSYEKKILPHAELIKIKNHYNNLSLPANLGKFFKKKEVNKIVHFMQKDKKNLNEKINLILIKKIGKINNPGGNAYLSGEIKKFLNSQI